jgi:hypothetical protein
MNYFFKEKEKFLKKIVLIKNLIDLMNKLQQWLHTIRSVYVGNLMHIKHNYRHTS